MNKKFSFKLFFLILLFAALILLSSLIFNKDISSNPGQPNESKTFFQQFIVAGGPIVWFVLLPLSVVTMFLVIEYSLTITRKKLIPQNIKTTIVQSLGELGVVKMAADLETKTDFISVAILQSLKKGKGDWFRMRSALSESLNDQATDLFRKIEWLSLIGNVSPMVGLFGTVFGMIKLFNTIVISGGDPKPADLAGGISVALVTTFWGLFIAIPALAIYGVFRNHIEILASDALTQAEEIMPKLRSALSVKKTATNAEINSPKIAEAKTKNISQLDSRL